ncbi:MAG: agmatine deiminase family protein [Trueperaceae bacterium]|nr:agmatine deiminase family protein [Trueperaceae bacterium]
MLHLEHPTPADLGFRMPAEWGPHAATWTSWPSDDDLWEGQLDAVRAEFVGLVATLARFEPVVVNVTDDEAEDDARRRLATAGADLARVRFHRVPLDDAWFRDNGPIFVVDGYGCVAATDWRFNAWGGKYAFARDDRVPEAVARGLGMRRFAFDHVLEGGAIEVDDEGMLITTRSCLLTPTRNPLLGEHDVEALLRAGLGVRHVIWLDEGLEGDHTDGHVDTIVRFSGGRTIVCAVTDDEEDANFAPTQRNLAALRALTDPDGKPYRIVELPLPRERMAFDGRRLAASYANWYVANGVVIVPIYDDPHDARALEILRPLFPEREVIGLPARALITGGGAWHCVTQQQPAGEVASEAVSPDA